MKKVTVRADLDPKKCVGCSTCTHVCPVSAFRPNPDRPIERTKIPPCAKRCPAGNDIEGFIKLAAEERFEEALLLLRKTNPFPAITGRVCFHPCEEACNRNDLDGGVSISSLERFISEQEPKLLREAAVPIRREKVAIVGSGPAGLTCAYYLLRKGYHVTVFESRPLLGGWLRYGIPEYRLPRTVLDREILKIKDLGLHVRENVTVGDGLSLDEMAMFDAIFIASGRHRDARLNLPGEECEAVISGGEFLRRFHSGRPQALGKRVAVIGGGNSAVDAARVALRLGSSPLLIYRRSRDEMPAFRSEVMEMETEGVDIHFLAVPVRFVVEHGKLKALECIRLEFGGPDATGRRSGVPVLGSEFSIEADAAIVAVGQEADLSYLYSDRTTEAQKVETDLFCRTSQERIFAGGDVTSGMGTVPSAIRSGRMAAESIDHFLESKEMEEALAQEVVGSEQMNPDYFETCNVHPQPRLPLNEAVKGFGEIYLGYDGKTARAEAERCLGCASLPLYRPEDCRGCGNCEQRCPTLAIRMEPLSTPFVVKVAVSDSDPNGIADLCRRAHLHPKSIVCFCTTTRAEEIAAAILQGAKSPEQISLKTGARTGCTVLCIEPIFRLLEAAKVDYALSATPDVWYKTIPQIWDIPEETRSRFDIGFRFEEDIDFYKKLTRS